MASEKGLRGDEDAFELSIDRWLNRLILTLLSMAKDEKQSNVRSRRLENAIALLCSPDVDDNKHEVDELAHRL